MTGISSIGVSSMAGSSTAGIASAPQSRDLLSHELAALDKAHSDKLVAPLSNPLANDAAQSADMTAEDNKQLRKVFGDFVGQTFYGQMLSAMRKTVDKPAYFHGGRAEEVFQAQLDQVLSEKMSDATADQFVGPMFDLFMMNRR